MKENSWPQSICFIVEQGFEPGFIWSWSSILTIIPSCFSSHLFNLLWAKDLDHWLLYPDITISDSRLSGRTPNHRINGNKCRFLSAEECLSQYSDKLMEEYGVIIWHSLVDILTQFDVVNVDGQGNTLNVLQLIITVRTACGREPSLSCSISKAGLHNQCDLELAS